MKTVMMILVACVASTAAEARPHRHHYGLICGVTQMAHFGITDRVYAQALRWLDFQSTSPQADAVVVQYRAGRGNGHVSRIVQVIDQCHALVTDEKGTYKRDICRNLAGIVMPSSGPRLAHSHPPRSRHSGHQAPPRERTQYAAYAAVDRFTPR